MPLVAMAKGGNALERIHPTDRARGQTAVMPGGVATPWQSRPDHWMVLVETTTSGPGLTVSLQETFSETLEVSATVILVREQVSFDASAAVWGKGIAQTRTSLRPYCP